MNQPVEIKPDLGYLVKTQEKLYAENELRLRESLKRCTDALHLTPPDRIPVWQVSQTSLFPRHELFYDPEKNLMAALSKNIMSMQAGSDFVPFLDPFEGVTIIAEAFGCKTHVQHNGDPVVSDPIIKKAEDVYSLKKPDLDHPVFRRIFETQKVWGEATGWQVPIGTTDPQSPLDVVSIMWETENFYMSLYDNPKEMHYILDLVTETFIEFYSEQLERIENPAFPVHLFPLVSTNDGIAVSEDQMINMSPALYEEFGLQYLDRVSESFGGIYFHSCGNFERFFDQVFATKNLRAVNGHLSPIEIRPEAVRTILDSGIGLFIGISDRTVGWDDQGWESMDTVAMYHDYYLPAIVQYSKDNCIVITGYGSYRGYFDTPESEKGKLTIDGRGRPVEEDPLINVPLPQKQQNVNAIYERIDELQRQKAAGSDVTDNDRFRRYASR